MSTCRQINQKHFKSIIQNKEQLTAKPRRCFYPIPFCFQDVYYLVHVLSFWNKIFKRMSTFHLQTEDLALRYVILDTGARRGGELSCLLIYIDLCKLVPYFQSLREFNTLLVFYDDTSYCTVHATNSTS